MAKAKRPLKGIKKRPKLLGPQSAADKVFCEQWLIHFDKDRAYREAGFKWGTFSGRSALRKLEKFADYLRPIREAKAKLIAERLLVDGDKVLAGMVKKAFFDPTTFYERTAEPLTELVKLPRRKRKVMRVVMWDGKPVYGERMKPYTDLTPEQQAVVEVTSEIGERLRYRLPTIREQHMYFTSIGTQLGMFAQKLILERHQHKHQHHHLDFANIPTARLQSLTRQMLPLVDLEFAQLLGYTPEDVEAAALEASVVSTVAEKSTA